MVETPEQFAARPIWEPHESIMATAENIDALKVEFPEEAARMKIGSTLMRRKPEQLIPRTDGVAWWKDGNGNRWIAYGEYRKRI